MDGLDAVEEDRETRVCHVIERLDLAAEQLPQRLKVLRSWHRPRLHVPFQLLYFEILGNKRWLLSSWFSCFCCDIFAFAFALSTLGFGSQCFFVISGEGEQHSMLSFSSFFSFNSEIKKKKLTVAHNWGLTTSCINKN